jgi:hypothetical protein
VLQPLNRCLETRRISAKLQSADKQRNADTKTTRLVLELKKCTSLSFVTREASKLGIGEENVVLSVLLALTNAATSCIAKVAATLNFLTFSASRVCWREREAFRSSLCNIRSMTACEEK